MSTRKISFSERYFNDRWKPCTVGSLLWHDLLSRDVLGDAQKVLQYKAEKVLRISTSALVVRKV
jgi:hypothetical protein